MDYIQNLSREEKIILCKMITGGNFKELFKKNEREFSKIQTGFRAKTLSDKHALTIACNNADKPFVAAFINERVDVWLKEIQENVNRLVREGLTHDVALATTMLDSVFDNHVDLYFKLAGITLDAQDSAALIERMRHIQSDRDRDAEIADRVKGIEEEKQQLLDQLETAQQSAASQKAEYEQKIQEIERDKSVLEASLTEANGKIMDLQAALTVAKDDNTCDLAQFDDTDASVLPSLDSGEIVSLCGVFSDYNGQKWLLRYADLNHQGCYYLFRKSDELPPYFANRDKIFFKDGPSEDGFCGVWNWTAIPNAKDPSKDYVTSRCNRDIEAIEVVCVADVSDLDELVSVLKGGMEYQPHSRKVMFACCVSKGQYLGILCNAKDLSTTNGKTTLSEACIEVPVYEFPSSNIMRLDNRLAFYRNAFAGVPSRLYSLKSALDIIQDIVLSSISWSTYKARGMVRAEYKTFKEFLSAIPVDGIISQIESSCRCSNSAAKELLDEFLNVVWKYVDGDSLEDEIILSAISASTELQNRIKALLRADWEAENKSLLDEAEKKLDLFHTELADVSARLAQEQEALNRAKSEEERLANMISDKEKLAENVEKAVADRIQSARENAAEFIANMAFVGGQQVQVEVKGTSDADKKPSAPPAAPYRVSPAIEDQYDLEAHHNWSDVINTAILELGEAGVAEQYRSGLAAFLSAAYIEKQPILLVGPNAIDIAEAFCAAVTGHGHGLLCCEGALCNQAIAEMGMQGESVVIVNNLLASGWMNRIPEILSKREIFFIVTHPYAEDIQAEPRSLYGFVQPLFTEFIVEKKATGQYYGGYFAEDFKAYSASKGTCRELRILSRLRLSALVRNRISRIVATMHGICSTITADEEFVLAVLPIAYASLEMNELREAIADPQRGIAISEGLKRDLQYVLGEDQ